MAWLCKDKDGTELIFSVKPMRYMNEWVVGTSDSMDKDVITLPSGSIAKLIGRELTWEDEPVMIE